MITVDDGEIVGIGGLLDDNERRTIEKIPLLGDLPVIGNLFKSKSRSRAKTNLMVFIRPTILRSAADARAMTERRYGYIRGMQYQSESRTQSRRIDELVREYMGMVPPEPGAARRRRRSIPAALRAAGPARRPGRGSATPAASWRRRRDGRGDEPRSRDERRRRGARQPPLRASPSATASALVGEADGAGPRSRCARAPTRAR